MSDSCPKCCEPKKDCRCTNCAVCDADIAPEVNQLKIIFKRKKIFCRLVDYFELMLHRGVKFPSIFRIYTSMI